MKQIDCFCQYHQLLRMPLTLYPDAQLHLHESGQVDQYKEVAWCAHQHLFEPITLAPDVLLVDVLQLLQSDPVLKSVYRHCCSSEILNAVRAALADPIGAAQKLPSSGIFGIEDMPFDALELRHTWLFNTHSQRYYGVHELELLGVAVPNQELLLALGAEGFGDLVDPIDGKVKQEIGMVDVAELMHLPLYISPLLLVCEGDPASRAYMAPLRTCAAGAVTLGQLMQSVLAELSTYGAPDQMREMREAVTDELDVGGVAGGPLEGMVMPDTPEKSVTYDMEIFGALTKVFKKQGVLPTEIGLFLRTLPDEAPVAAKLAERFGSKVELYPLYANFTARELRREILRGLSPDEET
ncbi:hypothetical protein [Comamonas thiooxydans]|uniref:hypothetical protein n=1 Tax=Comamonas thiooxydans TaxID=363952 RepID=UPI000B4228CE|nr:hypothetical protein [Comamonas thiooxydans]